MCLLGFVPCECVSFEQVVFENVFHEDACLVNVFLVDI